MERRSGIGDVVRGGGPRSPDRTTRWQPQPAAAERSATREYLVDALGELLSATPDQVDELIEQLRGDPPQDPSVDPPDAFERGLELGLLVGLGSRKVARQVIAGD